MLERKVLELEQDYRVGYTKREAARRCDVNYSTASWYFAQFKTRAIPRKTTARKPSTRWQPPVYTGPEWIGKPA